ncbi:MAG: branched-chain amino acid transport system ATP-binding protein [Pseudonocardiales bacterium]|jgi:branched-chain amino acid transport system ATP-binding protein|nr:branched-chain amino acid transport system ATP-binding protein [Pseudonocardiales bacterium]
MLTLDGVFAGYGGGDILRGVNLTIQKGSITCVVGPNGAGKSTLLKVVSGLIRPRLGSLSFLGEPITGKSPQHILRRGIVQVMQSRSLFPDLSVRDNVELGAFLVRDKALVRKRMNDVIEQFPIVRERLNDRAGALSGGQQRMVEFARALMLDPALVVLDEPSMGLEPKSARLMYGYVRQMQESGRTILLVEQNVRAGLELANRGVVMEAGRVRLEGSGSEILANPQMRQLYLGGGSTAENDAALTGPQT